MKRTVVILCCAAALAALSGCDQARRAIGMEKQSPDEFAVVTRAPLNLPPDYGLRPPAPGTERPQEVAPRDQARKILLGKTATAGAQSASPAGRFSKGESVILSRAGALNADPSIRNTVNVESKAIATAEESLLKKIIFWQKSPEPGVILDADKENRRLREASALGTSPKGEVPVIKRKEKGWLEGIF